MTEYQHHPDESRLLDEFMEALNRDINAPVPPGLDPELAAFTRDLVRDEQRVQVEHAPLPDVQARVWQRTLQMAEISGHQHTIRPYVRKTRPGSNGHRSGFTISDSDRRSDVGHRSDLDHREEKTVNTIGIHAIQLNHKQQPYQTKSKRWPDKGFTRRRVYLSLALVAALTVIIAAGLLLRFAMPNQNPSKPDDVAAIYSGSSNDETSSGDAQQQMPTATFTPTRTPLPAMGGNDSSAVVLSFDEPISATLTPDSPEQRFSFQAQAGDMVEVRVSASQPVYFGSYTIEHSQAGEGGGGGGGGGTPEVAFRSVFTYDAPSTTEIMIWAPDMTDFPVEFTVMASIQESGTEGVAPTMMEPTVPPPDMGNSMPEFPTGEMIEPGASVEGELTADSPMKTYTFTALAGDIIQYHFQSEQAVYMESGERSLPEIGASGGGGGGGGGGPITEEHRQMVFSYHAEAYIRISAAPDATFPVHFTLSLTGEKAPVVNVDESISGEINMTEGRYTQLFTFQGQRGDVLNFVIEGNPDDDLSMTITEAGSPGVIAMDDDSGAGYLPEILDLQLEQTGTYWIQISNGMPLPGKESLTFLLNVNRHALNLDEADSPVEIALSDKQPARLATFTAEGGEAVRLTVRRKDGASVMAIVTALQNGQDIAVMNLSEQPQVVKEFTVPASGEVMLSFNTYATPDMGGFTLLEIELEHLSQ